MEEPIEQQFCPLCQQVNLCDVDNIDGCWCTKKKVPKELIDKVPAKLKKKACICQQCIQKFNSEKIVEIR